MFKILCSVEELRMKEVVPFIDIIAPQQEIESKCQHCGSGILIYRRMLVKFVTDCLHCDVCYMLDFRYMICVTRQVTQLLECKMWIK